MGQSPLGFNLKNSKNALTPGYADSQAAQWVTSRHGKYYASNNAQLAFSGANQSGATLSAGLATTYTGLCLSNPAASGVNLVVQKVSGALIVAPAAVLGLGLITGYLAAGITTHTTPLTPAPRKIGSSATPAGLVDAACTLVGTPVWTQWLADNSASAGLFGFVQDTEGEIILQPGAYLAIGANVAGPTAGFLGAISWEELPIAST